MKLFQNTSEKDSKLMACYSTIPKNATYTSAAMQNEIMELLRRHTVSLVVDEIKCFNVHYFILKCDGTRDLSNTENLAIVIRYLQNSRVLENLVAMPTTQQYDTETLADLIIKELTNLYIDPKRMLSQCFDDAFVMPGKIGGIQRKIQNRLEKHIPYVHCLNHQLHLVVVNTIKRIPELATFFDTVNILHNFIKRPKRASLWKGLKLPRLMEHRWSGHFTAIASVIENHSKIVGLLTECTDSSDSKTCIEATGILHQVRSPRFVFLAFVLSKFLHINGPVDKQLQSHKCDIYHDLGLLKIAKSKITKLRNSLIFDEILKQMSRFNVIEERMCRKACGSRRFSDYVVESLVPSQDDWITSHRKIYFVIIDESLGVLDNRFSEQNDSIYSSLASPRHFWILMLLKPLSNLVNSDKSALLSEFSVAKAYISKQNMMTLLDIFGSLRIVQDAFPNVYPLYGAALTFGSSTATCESSFSTLTRIMTPFRRNMKHQRKPNLVILASLNKYKSSIEKDDILKSFALRCRRLQLY
ncbi:uncharacterized protein LOC115211744 [Octopus sinensis]|uniref:Uncharacterized protein LOC115211744 n=1 Tax=Octopus sinensis TaxID=2607531 RepID=A0A6P7SDY8_9MOLL|nr:uncharacterized protein LOC115211744 [Octopus sinensis]